MMWQRRRKIFCALLCVLLHLIGAAGAAELVMLDIGHSTKDRGTASPDRRLTEAAFWYKNAGEVKRLIEEAGFRCIVCNRGNAPTQEPLASYAKAAGVIHLNKPDKGACAILPSIIRTASGRG